MSDKPRYFRVKKEVVDDVFFALAREAAVFERYPLEFFECDERGTPLAGEKPDRAAHEESYMYEYTCAKCNKPLPMHYHGMCPKSFQAEGTMQCPHCGRSDPHQHFVDSKGNATPAQEIPSPAFTVGGLAGGDVCVCGHSRNQHTTHGCCATCQPACVCLDFRPVPAPQSNNDYNSYERTVNAICETINATGLLKVKSRPDIVVAQVKILCQMITERSASAQPAEHGGEDDPKWNCGYENREHLAPAPAEQVKQPSALRVAFADFLVATHKSLHETADSLGIKLLRNEPAVSAPGESQAVGEEKHRPIGNYETLLSDLRRFIEHQFHERALALQEITSLQSSLDAARVEVERLKTQVDPERPKYTVFKELLPAAGSTSAVLRTVAVCQNDFYGMQSWMPRVANGTAVIVASNDKEQELRDALAAARRQLEERDKRIAVLEKALRPFAYYANAFAGLALLHADNVLAGSTPYEIKRSHILAAAAALSNQAAAAAEKP